MNSCFVLAKKLMVTKRKENDKKRKKGFVLAKKLMVTKHMCETNKSNDKFCSSEKINGNKTTVY